MLKIALFNARSVLEFFSYFIIFFYAFLLGLINLNGIKKLTDCYLFLFVKSKAGFNFNYFFAGGNYLRASA